jgi:hypothetical protein
MNGTEVAELKERIKWIKGLGVYLGDFEDRLQSVSTRISTLRDRVKEIDSRLLKSEFEIVMYHPKPHELWGCAPPPPKPPKKNISKPSKDDPE